MTTTKTPIARNAARERINRLKLGSSQFLARVLNSDAHSVRELSFLRYGIGIARRAWLGPEHVLNTRSADDLQKWRAERRR